MDCANKLECVKRALLAMQRHSWEQGVAMQGFLEQGDMDIVIAMAKEAAYRRLPDGRVAVLGASSAATDPCSAGEAIGEAAKVTEDGELQRAYEKLLEWALWKAPRNEAGIVYHFTNRTEFWIDSMYMLPPFLAAAGYYKEALQQIYGYYEALFHPEKKLFSHMWDDEKKEYVREAAWGVGNGWALAGITRVIEVLPAELAAEKQKLIDLLTPIIRNILSYMTENGLFHDVIDDENTFLEVNLSQMLAYTLFRGMKGGWLAEDYLSYATTLRKAAMEKVDAYGLVQDVCGAPHFDKPGVAPEGQAFYLLMEAAAKDYYNKA